LIAVLSAIVAGFLFTTLKSETKQVAPLGMVKPLWGALFREGGRTTIVVGDSGLVIWPWLAKRNMSLDEYLAGEYRSKKSKTTAPSEMDSTNLGNRRYTSIVDLEGVQGLSSIAQSNQTRWKGF